MTNFGAEIISQRVYKLLLGIIGLVALSLLIQLAKANNSEVVYWSDRGALALAVAGLFKLLLNLK